MGFLSGGMSYVSGKISREITVGEIEAAVSKFQFISLEDADKSIRTTKSVGWKLFPQMDGSDTSILKRSYGYFVSPETTIIALRYLCETKKVPASVLKENIKFEEENWKAKNGSIKRPPKQIRLEIREALEAELLQRAFPKQNSVEILIDIKDSKIRIFSLSTSLIDEVVDLFQRSFVDCKLSLLTTYDEIISETQFKISEMLHRGVESYLDKITSIDWITQDFLLFGLSRQRISDSKLSEALDVLFSNSTITMPAIMVEKNADTKSRALLTKMTTKELEALIGSKKFPISAGIVFEHDDLEILATVSGDFVFSQWKCFGIPKAIIEELMESRLQLLRLFESLRLELLSKFSTLRMSDDGKKILACVKN